MELLHDKYSIRYMASCLIAALNGIFASMVMLGGTDTAFMRALISMSTLGIIFLVSHKGRVSAYKHKQSFAYLAASGACLGINWMMNYQAFELIGVSLTIVICYMGPVMAMALSPLIFHEKLTANKLIGLGVVLVGVVCVNGLAVSNGVSARGLGYATLSALTFAGMLIFNKKTRPIESTEVPFWLSIFAFLTLAVLLLAKGRLGFELSLHDLLIMLVIGIGISATGNWLAYSSTPNMPVQTASVLGYLEPMCAVVLSALVLGERLEALQIAGIAMIIAGIVIAEFDFAASRGKAATASDVESAGGEGSAADAAGVAKAAVVTESSEADARGRDARQDRRGRAIPERLRALIAPARGMSSRSRRHRSRAS